MDKWWRLAMLHYGALRKIDKRMQKYFKLTLASGILFLIAYFFFDDLFEKLWMFSLLPLFLFGLASLIFFILSIDKNDNKGIVTGLMIIGTVVTVEIIDSEFFKSKKILEAYLKDDLSGVNLTLRENNTFEVISSTIYSEQTFKGEYVILDNKIFFHDKLYNNGFIPDTLTIIGDKIICRFDKDGNPSIEFATYFDIKRNEIKNAP